MARRLKHIGLVDDYEGCVYDADHWCQDCLRKYLEHQRAKDICEPGEKKITAISRIIHDAIMWRGWSEETDSPMHCNACGIMLPGALTTDGMDYMRAAVQKGDGDPKVLALWREQFDYIDFDTRPGKLMHRESGWHILDDYTGELLPADADIEMYEGDPVWYKKEEDEEIVSDWRYA